MRKGLLIGGALRSLFELWLVFHAFGVMAGPPIPFVAEGNKCMTASCKFWDERIAQTDTVARIGYQADSPVVFQIKKGERFYPISSVVVTTRLGIAKALKTCSRLGASVRAGDTIYVLYTYGEVALAWHKDKRIDIDLTSEDDGCLLQISPPESVWYLKIEAASGKQGWVVADSFRQFGGELLDAYWLPLTKGQRALEFSYSQDGTLTFSNSGNLHNIRMPPQKLTRIAPDRLLVSAPEFACSLCGFYLIACDKQTDGESCAEVYRIERNQMPPHMATAKSLATAWFSPPYVLILAPGSYPDQGEIYRVDTRTGESRRLLIPYLRNGYFAIIAADQVSLSADKQQLSMAMTQGCMKWQEGCRDELKTSHVMIVDVATWEAREVSKQSPGLLTLPFAVGETWYVCRSYNGPDVHQGRASLDLSIDPRSPGHTGCTPDTASSSKDKVVLSPASGLVLAHFNGEPKDMLCLWLDEKRDVNGDGTPDELFLKIGHLQGMPPENSSVERGARLGTLTTPSKGNGGYSHIHIELVTGDRSTGCTKAAVRVPFAGEVAFQGAPDLPYDGIKNQWQGISLTK